MDKNTHAPFGPIMPLGDSMTPRTRTVNTLDAYAAGINNQAFALNSEDGARFVRILSESRLIVRQPDLLAWLKGEVQQFLPHQLLIAAWGDFPRWNVNSEVVSNLPGE